MAVADSILAAIGNTPLVRLREVTRGLDAEVLVKAEYLNPSGSIKDRIALYMIESAERQGKLKPGYTIIEATTGNTGAALALVAAARGYRMRAFAPKIVASPERVRILESYGAEIEAVEVDAQDSGAHGAFVEILPRKMCLELEKADPTLWWARQFSNPGNVAAHRETTGREIIEQAGGRVDAFAASIGTGGTLLGIAQALRAHDSEVKIYGVEPTSKLRMRNGLQGYPIIPGVTDGIILDIFKANLLADVFTVSDAEASGMAHQLAEKEGLFCGMSSGANVFAALKVAETLGKGARVVTVLPDSRDRYLSFEKYTT